MAVTTSISVILSAVAAAVRLRIGLAEPESVPRITLVTGGDDLVIRPRLYESRPEAKRVSLDRVLGPLGVKRVTATVTDIDTAAKRVRAVGQEGRVTELSYDRLVLATGSHVIRPDLPGAERLFDVDTVAGAAELDSHLHRLAAHPAGPGRFTAVVVGAGFTGLEIATELVDRLREVAAPVGAADQVRVVLVEREPVVGPDLGRARARTSSRRSMRCRRPAARSQPGQRRRDRRTAVRRTELAAERVVWTAGMLASPLTAQIPAGRDRLGRLEVDEFPRVVGVPGLYAAGDTAAATAPDGYPVVQSCQHAVPLGKFAGHNVAADLLGVAPVPFGPNPYVTCLDLGSAGAVYTTGRERTVEMIEQQAKTLKRTINTEWIYPPLDNAEEILASANHVTFPTDQVAAIAGAGAV